MRSRIALLLAFAVLPSACVAPQPKCSEYRQVIAAGHAEISAGDQVRVAGGQRELSALDVSEEAALLSKRLKTLCDLLWAKRISYGEYHRDVESAYQAYERTRVGPATR